jgi:hypothetical protein
MWWCACFPTKGQVEFVHGGGFLSRLNLPPIGNYTLQLGCSGDTEDHTVFGYMLIAALACTCSEQHKQNTHTQTGRVTTCQQSVARGLRPLFAFAIATISLNGMITSVSI